MNNSYRPIGVDIFSTENIRNCEKYVLSVQRELDKAVANNDNKGIRETFDLLAKKSNAVKILSIQRITQRNQGKYTAGVDGIALPKTDKENQNQFRLKLLDEIDIRNKPNPIRRVHIPKPNGKKRPLGIPTLHDRIAQEILRTALEPIVEYHFHTNSYGFRPKRSCQDAMTQLYNKLSMRYSSRYIIEGDIKGCFDNINHEHTIRQLKEWKVPEWVNETINKILKTGIFHNGEVYDNETGTPQGGVISPLLANVALTAFDNFCYQEYGYDTKQYGKILQFSPMVRYADDFVITCKTEPQAERIKAEIAEYLHENIGLTLSEEKTKITHMSKGFNFLGFNFRIYSKMGKTSKQQSERKWSNYKYLTKPQKEKIQNLLCECQEVLNSNKTATQSAIIYLLNPKLMGWGMYYRHVVSKDIFAKIDHEIWWKLYRWSKRRHPNKSKSWIINKYFSGKKGGKRCIFKDRDTGNEIYILAQLPIKRFVKIKSDMRVFDKDPNTIEYWKKREYTNAYKQIESVKMGNLYKRQEGICPFCKGQMTQQQILKSELHVHHMQPRSLGGKEGYSNLRLLHNECHRELHAKYTRSEMGELSDKIDYINNPK